MYRIARRMYVEGKRTWRRVQWRYCPTPPHHPTPDVKTHNMQKTTKAIATTCNNNSFLRAPPLPKLHGRLRSRNHEDGAGCGGPPRRGPGGFYNIRAARRSGGKSREGAGWVQKRWTGNEAALPKGTQPGWWGSEGIEKKKDGRSSSTTRPPRSASTGHLPRRAAHNPRRREGPIYGGRSSNCGLDMFVRVALQSPLRQPFEGKQAIRPGNPVTKNLRHNSGMALPGRSANLGAWSAWAYRILVVETSSFLKEQARTLIFKGNGNNLTNFRANPKCWWFLMTFGSFSPPTIAAS